MFPQIERLLGDRIPKKTAGWSLLPILQEKTFWPFDCPVVLYLDNWFSLMTLLTHWIMAMFGMAYYS